MFNKQQAIEYFQANHDAAVKIRDRYKPSTGNWWLWEGERRMCRHALTELLGEDGTVMPVAVEPVTPAPTPANEAEIPV